MRHDGFELGRKGCYTCLSCGKRTRKTKDNVTDDYCVACEEIQMHENSHADNHFPNDECGWDECPVKHYTDKQKWWRK